jgi:hypothetical protein
MLDLTVDVDHTFYVGYGGDAIIVHKLAAALGTVVISSPMW